MNLVKKLFCKKADKKKSADNRGSSFVLVMVTIALIMILLAVIFVMIFLQYRMLRLSKLSKTNFYYLEEVLDEMRAGVGNKSIDALKASYDETQAMVVYYDRDKKKYMSTSSDTAMDILNNKFLDKIAQTYCTTSTPGKNDKSISEAELEKLLKSYVIQLNRPDADYANNVTSDGVKITFSKNNFHCQAVTSKNPVRIIGYTMTGIKVSRKDPKTGNLQSIDTDISIYPPKDTVFNFLASGSDVENVFSYAMVADYGIEVGSPTMSTNAKIVGNLYSGSDTRNNGIYHGRVVSADATSTSLYKITGDTSYREPATTPNASEYSGLFVTGNNTVLNLQSDVLDVNGDIAAEGDAKIVGSGINDNTRVATTTVYAKNISTVSSALAKNTKNFAAGVDPLNPDPKTQYNISLNGMFNISDDLELLANKSSIALLGNYFGYNYAAEEESQTASADATQITSVKPKTHTNSSAVIINGSDTTLNLYGLNSMIINGRSYVDLTAENVSGDANRNNTDVDIKMSDSIAQKGSQLLYQATDEGNLSTVDTSNADNRSMFTEGTEEYAAAAGDGKLSTRVPYYNMIKFLTYRFVKDGVAEFYGTQTFKSVSDGKTYDNPVYNENFRDMDTTNASYSKIWKDMETLSSGIKGSKYYDTIINFYFPKETKLSSEYSKADGMKISREPNKSVKVTDAYGNVMTIWRNDDSTENGGKGIYTGATTSGRARYAHRYGFIPVTKNGNMESLVKTSVGGKDYYYFQFYDEDAKKKFVLDYAEFCKATIDGQRITQAQDGSSVDTFSVDSISLPDETDPQNKIFTRGISAVLDAGSKSTNYKLIDSVASSGYDEATLMSKYNEARDNFKVYRCYFPESDLDIDKDMLASATSLYNTGLRSSVVDNNYSYSTKGEDISSLSNPDCINISWRQVGDSKYKTGNTGEDLKGYPGTKVWISDGDLNLNGGDYPPNGTAKGIILCQGNVTLTNMTSFRGTVICAGKLKILGNTSFYTDELMCQHMLENDTENQIRTCMGLNEYKEDNSDLSTYASLSSIDYTDIVAYENWVRNYDD